MLLLAGPEDSGPPHAARTCPSLRGGAAWPLMAAVWLPSLVLRGPTQGIFPDLQRPCAGELETPTPASPGNPTYILFLQTVPYLSAVLKLK